MARSGVLSVYIEESGPRARWIFKLIFEELLGLELDLIGDPADEQPMLNYSGRDIPGAISIKPFGLLSEQGIREQDLSSLDFEGMEVFFPVVNSELPFDPFSMAFYFVSRYEEYLPFEADKHGRFPHSECLAYKKGFHNKAVVNRIALMLKALIEKKYPDLSFSLPEYSFLPSVDIDIAYAHLGKSFLRTYGSMARLLLIGNTTEVSRRIRTMRGKARDPYDNFDFLLESFEKYGLNSIFFILAGDMGPHDRNLSTKNPAFASLLKELAGRSAIGVHPSYGAGNDIGIIKEEIRRLERVTLMQVNQSRQHFVRMRMPQTYEALIAAGITDDYSMGFASSTGFRAGIASSYYFYNLRKEEATGLRIHPFAFMDSTLSDYMDLSPREYPDAVAPLIRETREVNGSLCGIWHNYTLADDKEKHRAFEAILNLATER